MNNNHAPVPRPHESTPLPQELAELIEDIAKNVHDTWVASREAEGWVKGSERNDKLKTHPCLVPYEELPESEREYDRKTATTTLQFVLKHGFKIEKNR